MKSLVGLDVAVRAWLIVGVLMVWGVRVQAGPVTYFGTTFSETVDIHYNGVNHSVTAGQHRLSFAGEEHLSFSVDLDAQVLASWDADIRPVDVIHAGRPIAWLYDTFAPNVTSDLTAAGLQVAMWELLVDYDGTFDLISGNFRIDNWDPIALTANSYLESFGRFAYYQDPQTYVTSSDLLYSDRCRRSQHMIIPEPSLALPLAAFLTNLFVRRRRVPTNRL